MRTATLTLASLLLVCLGARAAVLTVPAQYATIRAAVDAAAALGDTVMVAPGDYPENVVVDSKSVAFLEWVGGVTRTASFVFDQDWPAEGSGGQISGFSVTGWVTGYFGASFTMELCSIGGPVSLTSPRRCDRRTRSGSCHE